jgi:hypothetical protein
MGWMRVCRVCVDRFMVYRMIANTKSTFALTYYLEKAGQPYFVIPDKTTAIEVKRGFVPELPALQGF